MILIDETLRLRRFDGNYDFAFECYQDTETVLLVDGKAESYSYETLTNMYNYLNGKGELYFIKARTERTMEVNPSHKEPDQQDSGFPSQ